MNKKFGPQYAVINLSKIGMRYFRLFIKASPASRERLVENFKNHPNVGWIFSAKGWFNLGIGLWAKDNAEINDISASIRNLLTPKDEIMYQSELTTLYGFGNRPVTGKNVEMRIVDSTTQPVELDPLSIDYLKLLTLDSSLSKKEFSEILGIDEKQIADLDEKFADVIVGTQERINYSGLYFKVLIDTTSRKDDSSVRDLINFLWSDKHCIYFEQANGKYDLEFEVILESKSQLKQYLKNFSLHKVAEMTENLYTNLFPLNKTANLKEIRDAIFQQEGDLIDLRNSKLWYLNYKGVEAYINIHENKKYMETMEKSELDLFDEVVSSLLEKNKDNFYSIIDLGSGDGLKGRIFIEKIGEEKVKACYPVDIQPIELSAVLRAHSEGKYAIHPTLLNFEKLSARFPLKTLPNEKQVYVFLGGTYGNFANQIINSYLKPILEIPDSTMVVTMPIRLDQKSDKEIVESYATPSIENVCFGPLLQLGFQKNDFKENVDFAGLVVNVAIEDDCLTTSFVLKKDIELLGRKFKKGTTFKMTTSWKPTIEEFRQALEKDFSVDQMFNNKDMAIAIISRKIL